MPVCWEVVHPFASNGLYKHRATSILKRWALTTTWSTLTRNNRWGLFRGCTILKVCLWSRGHLTIGASPLPVGHSDMFPVVSPGCLATLSSVNASVCFVWADTHVHPGSCHRVTNVLIFKQLNPSYMGTLILSRANRSKNLCRVLNPLSRYSDHVL